MLKSLLNNITRTVTSAIGSKITSAAMKETIDKAMGKMGLEGAGKIEKTYTFASLPQSLEEFKALPEASLLDVYAVAAMSVLALTRYEASRDECFAMLDFLKGPEPLSPSEKGQINDRFMDGKYYKPRSFFEGATPENNYTPAQPYRIKVSSNPHSFENEGWSVLYVHSGGSDNPRPVRLRMKPSTGQWFLVEIQYLGDIRIPAADDKWR